MKKITRGQFWTIFALVMALIVVLVIGYLFAKYSIARRQEQMASQPTEHRHSYVSEVKAPTCTQEGFTVYICGCGNSYEDDRLPPAGHQYDDTGKCIHCKLPRPSQGLSYRINAEKTAWLVDGIGTCTDLQIVVPDTHEGLPVTGIYERAFAGNTAITGIYLPQSVTEIGNFAFQGCKGLVEVSLPDTMTRIGEGTFFSCSVLTGIRIPDGVSVIEKETFYWCTGLQEVFIPDSVTAVSDRAFYNCEGLKALELPDSVLTVGKSAFLGCRGLEHIRLSENLQMIPEEMLAFCGKLTAVEIPASVTAIEKDAFLGVDAASYWIGPAVTYIAEEAFSSNYALEAFQVSEDNAAYRSLDGVLFSKDGTLLHTYPYGKSNVSYSVPEGVVRVAAGAFFNCQIQEISLPESLRQIGDKAFFSIGVIGSIRIPVGVERIGAEAFVADSNMTAIEVDPANRNYKSLDGVLFSADGKVLYSYPGGKTEAVYIVPEGVEVIAANAFSSHSTLTQLHLPGSLKRLERNALSYCEELTKIAFAGTAAQWDALEKEAFWDVGSEQYTVSCIDGN